MWIRVAMGQVVPEIGEVVLARIEDLNGGEVYMTLRYQPEDDSIWRTADDNSELSYNVRVTHWSRFTRPEMEAQ